MAPRFLSTVAGLRGLTWAAVGIAVMIAVIIVVASFGAYVGVSLDQAQNDTPPYEPRRAELPGGFNPNPELEATRSEIEYRGGDCMRDLSSLDARLYYVCAGDRE